MELERVWKGATSENIADTVACREKSSMIVLHSGLDTFETRLALAQETL